MSETTKRYGFVMAALFSVGVAVAHCGSDGSIWTATGRGPALGDQATPSGNLEVTEVQVACDPDSAAGCPEDWFICYSDTSGGKICRGQQSAVPSSDGSWQCYEDDNSLVCRGSGSPPSGSGIWDCDDVEDSVVCRAHSYFPDDVSDWDCWYDGVNRLCRTGVPADGTGSNPPGGTTGADRWFWDLINSNRPGNQNLWNEWFGSDQPGGQGDSYEQTRTVDRTPGGGGEVGDNCRCVPGSKRYCDTPSRCSWGIQYCKEDGLTWDSCVETTSFPPSCLHLMQTYGQYYSPEAEECCVNSGSCCQDFHDIDRDGDVWESMGTCQDIICA